MVDAQEGVVGIEWIEGESVRVLLGAEDEGTEDEGTDDTEESSDHADLELHDPLTTFNTTSCELIPFPLRNTGLTLFRSSCYAPDRYRDRKDARSRRYPR